MSQHQSRSQGFVLIAALLLMFLLSGVAVGIMMLTNSEIHVSSNDKESNMAYYGAESGMEKLTSDLAALYGSEQAPSTADIQALALPANAPSSAMVGQMTYGESITFPLDANGNPAAPTAQTISSGPNQGLTALVLPMTMNVNVVRPSSAAANITRNVEVALIPVFQFGIFSESDLSFNNGANFGFGGRIHTNGNLFLVPQTGGTAMLGDKTTVFGEVIRDLLQNGAGTGTSFTGTPYQANAATGCNAAIAVPRAPFGTETNCQSLTVPSASWSGGIPPGGGPNSSWINTSTVSFNGFIGNPRSTGVQKLTLPFTKGGGLASDIIRRPFLAEAASSATGQSRLYNKANIRVILADTLQALHQDGSAAANGDGQDVLLTSTAGNLPVFGGDAVAYANPAIDAAWKTPLPGALGTAFPLVTGYLRVEIKNSANVWTGVTQQWLALGIGRNVSSVGNPNPIASTGPTPPSPTAILLFQELASNNTGNPIVGRTAPGTGTNWYPINFYDPREGLVRDANAATTQCTVNGIMNAVELDMGNLKAWMATATGQTVEYTQQNGYVLYFSDRRGMLPSVAANAADGPLSTAGILTGEYGFEDVVNVATSVTGAPNNILDLGEDANGNTVLDTYGKANVGNGFRVTTATANFPYANVDCLGLGRMNWVGGARHVLRLIDGTVGNLPLSPNNGGLTVASENPVYIQGDYNANAAQGFTDAPLVHAPAAVIADAVTLLSNSWNDINDMTHPTAAFSRLGSNTWYRLAVAGGKTLTFSNPGGSNDVTWGTDGGAHNFLRYIEAWDTAAGASTTLAYQGSLVSLYSSTYATGTYKFGASGIYNAPNRQYSFDQLFLLPSNLPPATPMFQDVVNLSYRQDFTPY